MKCVRSIHPLSKKSHNILEQTADVIQSSLVTSGWRVILKRQFKPTSVFRASPQHYRQNIGTCTACICFGRHSSNQLQLRSDHCCWQKLDGCCCDSRRKVQWRHDVFVPVPAAQWLRHDSVAHDRRLQALWRQQQAYWRHSDVRRIVTALWIYLRWCVSILYNRTCTWLWSNSIYFSDTVEKNAKLRKNLWTTCRYRRNAAAAVPRKRHPAQRDVECVICARQQWRHWCEHSHSSVWRVAKPILHGHQRCVPVDSGTAGYSYMYIDVDTIIAWTYEDFSNICIYFHS